MIFEQLCIEEEFTFLENSERIYRKLNSNSAEEVGETISVDPNKEVVPE